MRIFRNELSTLPNTIGSRVQAINCTDILDHNCDCTTRQWKKGMNVENLPPIFMQGTNLLIVMRSLDSLHLSPNIVFLVLVFETDFDCCVRLATKNSRCKCSR